mmetsp:Transcript_17497/g.57310  ORF Transcript_17497/g.57310 Transcript_17497/m.57310 type:complete len:220 (+) Transcript_17497:843-1502(+)|eukprot:scaffold343_cov120-Isochrysis_galbana.AAC.10
MIEKHQDDPRVLPVQRDMLQAAPARERDGDEAKCHEAHEGAVVARADRVVDVGAMVIEDADATLEHCAVLRPQRPGDVTSVAEGADGASLVDPAVGCELEGLSVPLVRLACRADEAGVRHIGRDYHGDHPNERDAKDKVAERRVDSLSNVVIGECAERRVDEEEVEHYLVTRAALPHDHVEEAHQRLRVERGKRREHVPEAALPCDVDWRAPLIVLVFD